MVDLPGTGPATIRSLRHLFDDCQFTRVLLDAESVPTEVSKMVRTVPIGLFKELIVRDGGCTWKRCDAPWMWCQTAHGEHKYADRGMLAPQNSALLCVRHHRMYDNGPWEMRINGTQVTYHRTDRPKSQQAGTGTSHRSRQRAATGQDPGVSQKAGTEGITP